MKNTEWRDIKGFEGYYKIHITGLVTSLSRKVYNGNGYRLTKGKLMKHYDNGWGYLRVCLRKEGFQKFYLIHRLIAEHFIPNPKGLPIINHIDGDKRNNKISNLEWCDYSHNNQHGYDKGLIKALKGEKHPKSKLSKSEVLEIKKLLKLGVLNQTEIAEKFNVNPRTINSINKKHTWKHL